MNVPECSGPYWLGDEEKSDFNGSWSKPLSQASDPPTMWTYQSAWKLKTIPFKGKLATYSGAGYIVTMPSDHLLHEGNAFTCTQLLTIYKEALNIAYQSQQKVYHPNVSFLN